MGEERPLGRAVRQHAIPPSQAHQEAATHVLDCPKVKGEQQHNHDKRRYIVHAEPFGERVQQQRRKLHAYTPPVSLFIVADLSSMFDGQRTRNATVKKATSGRLDLQIMLLSVVRSSLTHDRLASEQCAEIAPWTEDYVAATLETHPISPSEPTSGVMAPLTGAVIAAVVGFVWARHSHDSAGLGLAARRLLALGAIAAVLGGMDATQQHGSRTVGCAALASLLSAVTLTMMTTTLSSLGVVRD